MHVFFATFTLKKFYDLYDVLMTCDFGPVVWGCSLTILTAARMWGEEGRGGGGGGEIINKSPRGVETGGTAALPNTCDRG